MDDAGGFTNAGRATREQIAGLTDELAAPAYNVLSVNRLDEWVAKLEPNAAAACGAASAAPALQASSH